MIHHSSSSSVTSAPRLNLSRTSLSSSSTGQCGCSGSPELIEDPPRIPSHPPRMRRLIAMRTRVSPSRDSLAARSAWDAAIHSLIDTPPSFGFLPRPASTMDRGSPTEADLVPRLRHLADIQGWVSIRHLRPGQLCPTETNVPNFQHDEPAICLCPKANYYSGDPAPPLLRM